MSVSWAFPLLKCNKNAVFFYNNTQESRKVTLLARFKNTQDSGSVPCCLASAFTKISPFEPH